MISMSVLKPIPPVLQIANFACSIRYRGQPPFCFGCKAFVHATNKCQPGKPVTQVKGKGAKDSLACDDPHRSQPTSFAQAAAASPVNVGAATSADYHSPSDTPRSDVLPVIMDVETGSVVALAAPPAILHVDAPVSVASAGVEEMMDTSIVPPSTTPRVDSTVDASVLAASAVDSDVMNASVASSAESRTTSTDRLVVEISEFKGLLSFGEDFACRRHVSIVQRRSTTRDKTKRLQKVCLGADVLKSSSLAATCGARSASTQSPQPPSTLLPSSAHVPGASPPSVSGKIRSSKFAQERRPYPTSRQPPASRSPSSSGEEIQNSLSL